MKFTAGAALLLTLLLWGNTLYIQGKAILAQALIALVWQQTLVSGEAAKPWPWADTWPVAKLGTLQDEAIVLFGAQGASLAFGPGHVSGTSLPGYPGASVVAGHRDTHFAFLASLRVGHRIWVQRRDGKLVHFEVSATEVHDTRQGLLQLNPETNELLLVTCYPFDAITPGGPLRYVVRLTPSS